MAFVKNIAGGLLGIAARGLFGGKSKLPAQPLSATRDEARIAAERDRELARRQGARADRVAGSGNSSGATIRLVSGS